MVWSVHNHFDFWSKSFFWLRYDQLKMRLISPQPRAAYHDCFAATSKVVRGYFVDLVISVLFQFKTPWRIELMHRNCTDLHWKYQLSWLWTRLERRFSVQVLQVIPPPNLRLAQNLIPQGGIVRGTPLYFTCFRVLVYVIHLFYRQNLFLKAMKEKDNF